ncbi:MAG: aromatic amino acid transport family protein [Patescibacteria group bacterium]
MTSKSQAFIKSVQSLIGTVIGVGIFGLPYVFSQAGYLIGIAYLIILGFVSYILVSSYGQITCQSNKHHRISKSVEEFLGTFWGRVASVALFCSNWGAMLAYIIIGGEFLHALLSPMLHFPVVYFQIIFFAVSAFILIGGLSFVSRMEVVSVLILLILLMVIMLGSTPYIDLSNLTIFNSSLAFLPFGVVFFSFGGLGTVPEMRDILGRHKQLLGKAIALGLGIVAVVYVLFSGVIVGVTGVGTTQEAILGLGDVVGNWAIIVGSLIGLFAVFTSFIILGVQVMDTAIYDYKARYFSGWAWAIIVPFLLFIIGARDFISVIGFTGGVFGVVIGLLVIAMYKKAKLVLPKRALTIPDWLLDCVAVILMLGMIATVWGVIV